MKAAGSVLFAALMLAAPAAWSTTLGPDDFGYTAADQAENGVDFEWVDTSAGTAIPEGDLEDDVQWGPFELGFTFEFYGVEYDEVYVFSNGELTFETVTGLTAFDGTQCPLPFPSAVDGMIAFYERDFNPTDDACGEDCTITYAQGGTEGSRYWAVSFENVPVFRSETTEPANPVTVQVVLYEGTNEIRVQVEDSGELEGGDAAIGVEAPDGIAGVGYPGCLTEGSVPDQTAIVFTPPSEGTPVVPRTQFSFAQPGDEVDFTFTAFNLNDADVTFDVAASGNEWDTVVEPTSLTVAPGASGEFTVSVTVDEAATGGDADEATITLTPEDEGTGGGTGEGTGGGEAIEVTTQTLVQDAPDDWQTMFDMPLLIDSPVAAGIGTDLWVISGTGYDAIGLTQFVTDFVQVLHLDGEFQEWEISFLCPEDTSWSAAEDCCANESGACSDPEAGTLTPMPEPRVDAEGCAIDDQIFVVGGIGVGEEANFVADTIYIYDTATDTWTTGATMPEGRFDHDVVCDPGRNMVYVIGGFGPFPEDPETPAESMATILAYDVDGDSWDDTLADMPGTRVTHSAELIDADTILVAGGFFDDSLSRRTDLYDIANDTWTRTGDLPWERFYHASAVLPTGRMCLIGGTSLAGGTLNNNDDSYDCYSDGFWIPQIARISEARTRVAGTNMGDSMVLVGGVEIGAQDNPFDPAQYDQLPIVERYPTGTLPPEPEPEPEPDAAPDAAPDAGPDGGSDAGGDISADVPGETGGDAAGDASADAGGGGGDDDGCGCSSAIHEDPANALLMVVLFIGLVVQARRR